MMNSKWISRGIPVLVATMVIGMGMMSCSTDPMSSNTNDVNTNEAQTYSIENGNELPDVSTPMEAPVPTSLVGKLVLDSNGGCWFLYVKPTVSYELSLTVDILTPKDDGRDATVYGLLTTQIQPLCSEFHPVFRVDKVTFKEPKPPKKTVTPRL